MNIVKNIFSNFKFKRFFILLILLILYTFVSAFYYSNAVCSDISDSVFRLHVIANSDSPADQNLKYIVRDSIIDYINEISSSATSKEEVLQIAKSNISEIQSIAINTVRKEGYDYSVNVEVGNFVFPKKTYGDITFPPGFYDALKVEIGEAKGQNWWCVMFPPLCFVDVTSGIVPDESKLKMQENLSQEEYKLISQESTNVKVKFKIVEVLQNFTISGIFM
mgnify:FL=1